MSFVKCLVALATALAIVSCATEPTREPRSSTTHDRPSPPVMDIGSGPESAPGYAMMLGLALVLTPASGPSNGPQREIVGSCAVRSKGAEMAATCDQTYIAFVDEKTKHETPVWVDEGGRFSFPIQPGQSFAIHAVNERHGLRSKPIRADKPGRVSLLIE